MGGLACEQILEEEVDVATSHAFLIAATSVSGLKPFTQPFKGSVNPSMNKTTSLLSEMSVTSTDSL